MSDALTAEQQLRGWWKLLEAQTFAPDTNIGTRQQWVKDEIARKIQETP